MKRIISTSLSCCCLFMAASFFISCSKQDSHKQTTLDLSGKILTTEQLSLMADKLSQLQEKVLLKSCDTVATEAEAQAIMEPMYESGYAIYQELIANPAVAPEDLTGLENVTYQQLVELSITATAAYASGITPEKLITCAEAALGIAAIREIMVTTGALMTVQGTLALLKVLGRRYCFGYIGLAISIYEFVSCVGLNAD